MTSLKGPGEAPSLDGKIETWPAGFTFLQAREQSKLQTHKTTVAGSSLRIGILHARWNQQIIAPLVSGARKSLLDAGVAEANIVTQSVPGSWELPLGVQRLYAASQIQSATSSSGGGAATAGDLLGGSTSSTDLPGAAAASSSSSSSSRPTSSAPFDAIIAIGVLIKGETKHFEYISEATTQGLMRVQLDAGVPVVLGVLTVLNEQQALSRAGVSADGAEDPKAHNHGEDWGAAAVELALKRREWAEGKLG
ncbi:MAG: hypothetical protein M1838_005659 [Thelocarpon superellum]|nr:MAG: hypothetical protein M1838_005659 [Thelocarpon superellum]